METFHYVALRSQGTRVRGTIEAQNPEDAIRALRSDGKFVVRIRRTSSIRWWQRPLGRGRAASAKHLAMFFRQLATLIRAGIHVLEGVELLRQQSASKSLQRALRAISAALAEGMQLSEAMVETRAFPPICIHMMRAGEMSGRLDESMERIAVFFERAYQTREKVKTALSYPILVASAAVVVCTFLLVKIVPTFTNLFATYHAQLPLPTRMVMFASRTIIQFGWVVILVVGLLYALHRYLLRYSRYRTVRDQIRLSLPVLGHLERISATARMARTLSSLFSSAVPILDSLNIAADAIGNSVVQQALQESAASLQAGGTLSAPMASGHVFSPMVAHMVAVGEQTGNLDGMLEKVAIFYEAELDTFADRFKALLEPVLILLLALVVGTIVLAVILPSFTLLTHIH